MDGVTAKGMLTISIYFIACNAFNVETSSWTALKHQSVTSYIAVTAARSRIGCLLQCRKTAGCAVTVFEASTRACYMQPTLVANPTAGNDLTADVYVAQRNDYFFFFFFSC